MNNSGYLVFSWLRAGSYTLINRIFQILVSDSFGYVFFLLWFFSASFWPRKWGFCTTVERHISTSSSTFLVPFPNPMVGVYDPDLWPSRLEDLAVELRLTSSLKKITYTWHLPCNLLTVDCSYAKYVLLRYPAAVFLIFMHFTISIPCNYQKHLFLYFWIGFMILQYRYRPFQEQT